jgi:hypothetical protein
MTAFTIAEGRFPSRMVRGKSSELDISCHNFRDCRGIMFRNRGNFKIRKTSFRKSDDHGTHFS